MQNWIFDIRSRSFVMISLIFVFVTILVMLEITKPFDDYVLSNFQSLSGNPALDYLMQSITEAGDLYWMLIFSIALLIIKRTRKIGLALMILLVISTLLTGYIKCGVDRDRPDLDFLGTPFPISVNPDTFALFCEGGANASYPSGHTARATIFGLILGFVLSERFPRGCYLLLAYPILMSISRMYIMQHFPMDVIGGAILGVLLAGTLAKKTKLYTFFKKSQI